MLVFPQHSVGRDWKSICVPCSCCEQIHDLVHMTRSTQGLYNGMRCKFPLPHNETNASYMEAMHYRCVKEQWHCNVWGVQRSKRAELEKRTISTNICLDRQSSPSPSSSPSSCHHVFFSANICIYRQSSSPSASPSSCHRVFVAA